MVCNLKELCPAVDCGRLMIMIHHVEVYMKQLFYIKGFAFLLFNLCSSIISVLDFYKYIFTNFKVNQIFSIAMKYLQWDSFVKIEHQKNFKAQSTLQLCPIGSLCICIIYVTHQ